MGNEVILNRWRDEDGWPPEPEHVILRRRENAKRAGITARQYDVLELVVEGFTNKQIGQRLFITTGTAAIHVRRLLLTLNVRNRAHLVGEAFRRDLIR